MVFKKLIIRNIATIADAEINFDDKPLANTPLFLIYGPTGAGKTTILDAICLALYDAAPRLDILNQKKRQFEDSLINKGVRNVNDVSNLIRHGATEAYVKLKFDGNDSRPYIATWSARFGTRGTAKGKLLDIDRSLAVENTDLIWEKKSDIDRIILSSQVVGMNYNNFLRTTLLPQGAFNRFLSAGRSEKAEILEKLAGLDRFTDLGEKITLKYKEVSKEKNQLESEVNNLALLTETEIKVLNDNLNKIIQNTKDLEKILSHNQTLGAWLDKRDVVLKSLEAAQDAYDESLKKITDTQYVETGRILKIRRNLAPLRAVNMEIAKYQLTLAEYQNELINIRSERSELKSLENKLSERCKKLSDKLILSRLKISTFNTYSKIISEKKAIYNIIDSYDNISNRVVGLANRIADLNKEKKSQQLKLSSLLTKLEHARETENAIIKEKSRLVNELTEISDSPLLLYKDKLVVYGNLLKADELYTLKGTQESLVALYRKEYDAADAHYHKIELSTLDAAETLRSRLSVGDNCPVCNSIVKEIVPSSVFKDLLKIAEEPRISAKHKLESADSELKKILLELEMISNELRTAGYSWPMPKETLLAFKTEVDNIFGMDIDLSKIAGLLQQAVQLEAKHQQLRNDIAVIEKTLIKKNAETKAAEQVYSDCKINIDSLKNKITAQSENQKEQQNELATLHDRISHYFPAWNGGNTASIKEKIKEIESKIRNLEIEYSHSSSTFSSLTDAIKTIKKGLYLTRDISFSDTIAIECDYDLYDLPGIIDEMVKRSNIVSGRILATETQLSSSFSTRENFIKSLDNELLEFIQDPTLGFTDEEASELTEVHDKTATLHRENSAILEKISKEVNAIEKNGPEEIVDPEFSRSKLNDEESSLKSLIAQNNQSVGAINETLRQNDLKLQEFNTLTKNYEKVCHKYDMMNVLNSYFGEAHFRDVICEYILAHLLENANYYLTRFSSRYTMFTQPGNLEVMIHDSESGEDRVFSTLSGGETFMASLALALGLASLQNVQDTPDIFFIDEGFGSLSANCLESVMSTLDNLKNIESRRVGIVSHIETLRDRIPVRLALHRNGPISTIQTESDN